MLASHESLALEVRVVLLRERCTLKDGQNSVRKVVDTTGTVVASYDYDAWGNILGQDQPSGWIFNHRAFGEIQDPNLGFTYLRARWMDPETGRFGSRDPWDGFAWDPTSLHRYLYALNEPSNLADPSGETSFLEVLNVLAIISLLVDISIKAYEGATGKAKLTLRDAGWYLPQIAIMFIPGEELVALSARFLRATALAERLAIVEGWAGQLGMQFTKHAMEQMAKHGFAPSAVARVLSRGASFIDRTGAVPRIIRVVDQVAVVIEDSKVITVRYAKKIKDAWQPLDEAAQAMKNAYNGT